MHAHVHVCHGHGKIAMPGGRLHGQPCGLTLPLSGHDRKCCVAIMLLTECAVSAQMSSFAIQLHRILAVRASAIRVRRAQPVIHYGHVMCE